MQVLQCDHQEIEGTCICCTEKWRANWAKLLENWTLANFRTSSLHSPSLAGCSAGCSLYQLERSDSKTQTQTWVLQSEAVDCAMPCQFKKGMESQCKTSVVSCNALYGLCFFFLNVIYFAL